MFGSSNPFGQSSVFGQTSNTSNPFAQQSFGGAPPFGSQTGNSGFGATSTSMFSASQASSPFSSMTSFGASSPAIGSSSSFSGSSLFGQKPIFGGFGSATQTGNFGGSAQPSQPAFGSSVFGSSAPFAASSQPAFGAAASAPFGLANTPATPAFGATTAAAFGFGSNPVFGSSPTPAFGGSTGSAFGAQPFGTSSTFGSSQTPVFSTSTSPAFGASSTPFGVSSAPSFGLSTPAFAQSASSPSFNFMPSPAFAQPAPTFGTQSTSFGAQAATPGFGGFGQSTFTGQRGGTRVAAFAVTTDTETGGGSGQPGKLQSISAMPVYREKSHGELRWEDYQLGDKGGPAPAAGGMGFGASPLQPNPFASTFAPSSSSLFSSSTSSNPFAPKASTLAPSSAPSAFPSFTASSFSNAFQTSPFASTSTNAFAGGSSSSSSSSPFGSSNFPSFGSTPSQFFGSASQSSPSPFSCATNFPSSQPSLAFPSVSTLGQAPTSSAFGQTSLFNASSSAGQTSLFGTTPSFGQTSVFNPAPQSSVFGPPSTASAGLFASSQSLFSPSNLPSFGQNPSQSVSFPQSQPSPLTNSFGLNFGQSFSGTPAGFNNSSQSMFAPNNTAQLYASQGANSVPQQVGGAINPFGTLPAMPQLFVGRTGTTPSVQYGISSLPVAEKSTTPVRISSLLASRYPSQRPLKLPARKYNPGRDGPKVPFFCEDELPGRPQADALFFPRENPRALLIRPAPPSQQHKPFNDAAPDKDPRAKAVAFPVRENGSHTANGLLSESTSRKLQIDSGHAGEVSAATADPQLAGRSPSGSKEVLVENVADGAESSVAAKPVNKNPNGIHEDKPSARKEASYLTLGGGRAGEAAIVYEHGADIEALMPKLRRSDYYTEPRIQELAAKERAVPGFCRHVKDFVIGRIGYGSIKFSGETDVRRLDLEALVQFNNREVIVYMDDSKKPPVGQGLNKPAEVTLLNIKCVDKKSGRTQTQGPLTVKYKEMLRRKAEEQGAHFVSYDPVSGEWKFQVDHFSAYNMQI